MNHRAILIACLTTLGLAVAGWSQADGKIAFLSYRDGASDVWTMNADGSDPVNLTNNRHCVSSDLAWSPDGAKIAYFATAEADCANWDVWVMDANGSNPQQLTDDSNRPSSGDRLAWSEDGSSAYYFNLSEIFTVALDGSGAAPMEWREGAWIVRRARDLKELSPDGAKRAFVLLKGDQGPQALVLLGPQIPPIRTNEDWYTLIPLAGQPDVELAELPFMYSFPVTWAPNSRRVAFASYVVVSRTDSSYSFSAASGEIWAVDIDGSNLVNLTNGLGGFEPAWQPVVPAATSVEVRSWGQIKFHR